MELIDYLADFIKLDFLRYLIMYPYKFGTQNQLNRRPKLF